MLSLVSPIALAPTTNVLKAFVWDWCLDASSSTDRLFPIFLNSSTTIRGEENEQTYDTRNRARDVLEEVVQHVSETKSDLFNFIQTSSTDN